MSPGSCSISDVRQGERDASVAYDGLYSESDIEDVVYDVFGANQPPRFEMDDLQMVDDKVVDLLQGSNIWKPMLPYIKRTVEEERLQTRTKRPSFVVRAFKRHPGVVHAARYWSGITDRMALSAALSEIRQAWSICRHDDHDGIPSHRETSKEIPADVEYVEETRKPRVYPPFDCEDPNSFSFQTPQRNRAPRLSAGSGSASDLGRLVDKQQSSVGEIASKRVSPPDNSGQSARSDANHGDEQTVDRGDCSIRGSNRGGDPIFNEKHYQRSCLLGVLGFGIQLDKLDPSNKTVRVALIAEWPGIGSIHDLLSGRIFSARRAASQEELVRWTRQAAGALVQICRAKRSRNPGDTLQRMVNSPRLCARNAFLFPGVKEGPQGVEDTDVFNVRVATFLGSYDEETVTWTQSAADAPLRLLMPPEWFENNTGVKIVSSPPRTTQCHGDRESTEVWGMGTLVFELSTGIPAGPAPLALRSLRDLLRDVPIGPRFIYGDIARSVMRLALTRSPGERARATVIAAKLEEIIGRTLRRTHKATDRQMNLLRESRLHAARHTQRGQRKGESEVGEDGKSLLLPWRVKEAVKRAEGRAKAFLRHMWSVKRFDSLSEKEKRRVRHRQQYRKKNKKLREWRRRCIRAAAMRHWTSCETATWISRLVTKAKASKKLPRNVNGVIASMNTADMNSRLLSASTKGDDRPEHDVSRNIFPDGRRRSGKEQGGPLPAAVCVGDEEIGEEEYPTRRGRHDSVEFFPVSDDSGQKNERKREVADGGKLAAVGDSIEALVMKAGINGIFVMKSMEDVLQQAEDALAQFVKGSRQVRSAAEVEEKRVDLMTRGLLRVWSCSTPSQLKMRELIEAIMLGVEASCKLTEEQKIPQLSSLARVLVEGYRQQVAMVDQGLGFAAARLQALARSARVRKLVASIWRQADEFAKKVMQDEREAMKREEDTFRAKQKEEALKREREEVRRYRLRLVPRVSSVTSTTMDISLPPFLIAAARTAKRFIVVETTLVRPSSPPESSFSLGRFDQAPRETADATSVNRAINGGPVSGLWRGTCVDEFRIHASINMFIREGSAVEVQTPSTRAEDGGGSNNESVILDEVIKEDRAVEGRSRDVGATFVRAVEGNLLRLGGLRPCATYRLSLGLAPNVRHYLLESARELGHQEAINYLEACLLNPNTLKKNGGSDDTMVTTVMTDSDDCTTLKEGGSNIDTFASGAGGGDIGAFVSYMDVHTLPDVPGVPPRFSYKVLTSAPAADPIKPGRVLSLRQWLSPYPAVANMDGASDVHRPVIAPGRPEPIVSFRWGQSETNGLKIESFVLERRIGSTGDWKKIGRRRGPQGRSTEAVDAPLRSIPVNMLHRVALEGLTLDYRVYAENALGAGGPSAHVEVNLQAFLGHLRAQAEHPQQTTMPSSIIQTRPSIPHEQLGALRLSQNSTSAGNFNKDAKDRLRDTCSAFEEEERLQGLGDSSAVQSLSTEKHCGPASRKDVDHRQDWNVVCRESERHSLPPVVTSGISGTRKTRMEDGSTIQTIRQGRETGNVCGGGARRQCLVRDAYGTGLAGARDTSFNNGGIFHAYLNLDKRLPGRLRRDRGPTSK